MTKPIITETIVADDPTKVTGQIRLYAVDGGGGIAYTYGGTPQSIGQVIRVSYNSSGVLKADDGTTALQLNPNVNTSGSNTDAIITPSNTVWQMEVRYPGVRTPQIRYLSVPDGAGPYSVANILQDPPGSINTAGSKAYTDAAIAALPGLGSIADQTVLGNNAGSAASATALTPIVQRRVSKSRPRQDDLLRPFFAALGNVDSAPVIILFGPADSIMQRCPGSYMGTVGTVQRLHEALARRFNKYGLPGRGWLPIYSDQVTTANYPYGWGNVAGTSTGAAVAGTSNGLGLGAWGRTLSPSDVVVHAEPLGFDGLDIYYTAQSTAKGSTVGISITDRAGNSLYSNASAFNTGDAGLSGTSTRSGNKFSTGQLSGIAYNVTLTVAAGAGKTAMIDYSYFHLGTVSSGVQIHNAGHAGYISNQFNSTSVFYDTVATLQPHLIISDTGTNDYAFSGMTSTLYATQLAAVWAGALAVSANSAILHVSAYLGQSRSSSSWTAYRDAAETAAAAKRVAFIDLYERMGDLSSGSDPLGLSDDNTHPNDKGHGVIAGAIDSVINPAGSRSAPSTAGGLLRQYQDSNGYPYLEGRLHAYDEVQAFSLGYSAILGPALALGGGTGGSSPAGPALFGVNSAGTAFTLFNLWKITGSTDATAATDLMNRQSVDARIGVPDGVTVQVSSSVLSIKNSGVTYAKIQNVSAGSVVLGRASGAGAGVVTELTGAQVGALVTPDQLAAATGAWSLGQNFTATKLTQSTATAANGAIVGETSGTDSANRTLGWAMFADSSYTNATVSLSFLTVSSAVFLNGLYLGAGTDTGQDVSYTRSGTNAATINATAGLTVTGNLTLSAKNIVTDTTTGMKIGTGATQKLGFYNATPVVQPSGASQAAVVSTASTQTTPWGFSTQAQADAIVTLVNTIRTALVAEGLMKGSA